jgi:hypothetical protein
MQSGSVLTRVGFNVGANSIGFNSKNHKPRKTAVDPDTVRKFFKDSDLSQVRHWYNTEIQRWFRSKKSFHRDGIFILDQTKLVVPKNSNYEDACMMPVDEYGHFYNTHGLSAEQSNALPRHLCYTMSVLLHTDKRRETMHVAGYDMGSGNEDELIQANRILPRFCENNPGLMKLLIMDRGYIDGSLIGKLKADHQVDVILPLRADMYNFKDAVSIAERENKWSIIEEKIDPSGKLLEKVRAQTVEDVALWDSCPVPMHSTVFETTRFNERKNEYSTHYWVLASTKKFLSPSVIFHRYKIRTEIEERYRQFKASWQISKFSSPSKNLIESHICFTLLAYSLLELYLRRNNFQNQIRQMIGTLRRDESLGKDAVVVYNGESYAVLHLAEYTGIIAALEGQAKINLQNNMNKIQGAT